MSTATVFTKNIPFNQLLRYALIVLHYNFLIEYFFHLKTFNDGGAKKTLSSSHSIRLKIKIEWILVEK